MRYIKIVSVVFFFLMMLPEQALAYYNPLAPVKGLALLIFPLIIFFTWIGGAYPILKSIRDDSWRRHIKYLTGIGGPLITVFAVYGALVSHFFATGFFILLIFAIYGLVRGMRMIRWGFIVGRKSGITDHMENATPWRLKLGGWLLVGFTLLFIITPLTLSPGEIYDSDTKSNMHNLFLGCKAFWADNDSSNNCTVDIASQKNYGYVQSSQVTITVSGDEAHFSATAGHVGSRKIFAMDHNGDITETSASLQKESERSWIEEAVGNVKLNLSLLGIL